MADYPRERLEAEWERAVHSSSRHAQDSLGNRTGDEHVCWSLRYDGHTTRGCEKPSTDSLEQLRQRLLAAMAGFPDIAWERQLDDEMTRSFTLELTAGLDMTKDVVIADALRLLQRIGPRPHEFRVDKPVGEDRNTAGHISLVLRVALAMVASGRGNIQTATCLRGLINILSEVRDMDYDDDNFLFSRIEAEVWSFVTGTWTRVVKLYLWYIVARHVARGYDAEWDHLLVLRHNAEVLKRRGQYVGESTLLPRYMCNWAFRLLQYNRAFFAMDFRHLFRRFRDCHDDKPARCYGHDPWNPCTGLHPLDCGRFKDKALVLPEQSVHTDECGNRRCYRKKWDKKSYDSLRGCARAVRVSTTNSVQRRATYVAASPDTMAISHVWSHGHGGRPGTGMNQCLHHRFSQIALRHGCDSYWIDTLAIPEDHTRRTEAIHHINTTFFLAKMVLILDRDIMDMEITHAGETDGNAMPYTPSTIPIELLETIFATFLVCDWNVRAWTMLEAMKGCRNLYLLCKDGQTLCVRDCLSRFCEDGSLDMATMLLAAQHLLPAAAAARESPSRGIDAAGATLIYRHATRPGDDMVIWSLMTNTAPQTSVAEFWRAMVGRRLHTGFLISNVPRLRQVPGFTWAPQTPYMRWLEGQMPFTGSSLMDLWDMHIPPTDGFGSRPAAITEAGLRAEWLYYAFQPDVDYANAYCVRAPQLGNPCLRIAACLSSWARYVAIIDAVAEDGDEHYFGRQRGGAGISSVTEGFAVIWSDDGERWSWYGVYAWRHADPPSMIVKELLIQ